MAAEAGEIEGMRALVTRFLEAFSAADLSTMRSLMAEDVVAHVTNAQGGMDRVEGREAYLGRIEAMDLPGARFSVELTQAPVVAGEHLVLIMVEVRAEQDERSLHNFAGHLLRVEGGRIAEWWMVDAKPAESDAFWG